MMTLSINANQRSANTNTEIRLRILSGVINRSLTFLTDRFSLSVNVLQNLSKRQWFASHPRPELVAKLTTTRK